MHGAAPAHYRLLPGSQSARLLTRVHNGTSSSKIDSRPFVDGTCVSSLAPFFAVRSSSNALPQIGQQPGRDRILIGSRQHHFASNDRAAFEAVRPYGKAD
jgi:hypothetical protein